MIFARTDNYLMAKVSHALLTLLTTKGCSKVFPKDVTNAVIFYVPCVLGHNQLIVCARGLSSFTRIYRQGVSTSGTGCDL